METFLSQGLSALLATIAITLRSSIIVNTTGCLFINSATTAEWALLTETIEFFTAKAIENARPMLPRSAENKGDCSPDCGISFGNYYSRFPSINADSVQKLLIADQLAK